MYYFVQFGKIVFFSNRLYFHRTERMKMNKCILIYFEFVEHSTSVLTCLPSFGQLCSKKHGGNYFIYSVKDKKIKFWAGDDDIT